MQYVFFLLQQSSASWFKLCDLTNDLVLNVEGTQHELTSILWAVAKEITCVTLEVSSWGKLGSQAVVPGVKGVQEQLTVSVSICVFILLLVDYNDISRSIQCAKLYEPSTIYCSCYDHHCGGGDLLFYEHSRGQIIVRMY